MLYQREQGEIDDDYVDLGQILDEMDRKKEQADG